MDKNIKRLLRLNDNGRRKQKFRNLYLVLLSSLVGLVSGLGAVIFFIMLDASKFLFMDLIAGYNPGSPSGEPSLFGQVSTPFRRYLLFILPAIGAGLGAVLVYFFAPEAEGHGTDAAIDAYHNKEGKIRTRVPLIKALASALTIGSGGSAGREGPIAQIGSGFGSLLGRLLKLDPATARILMVAGMAGGIGAIFRAPLAGTLFATEVLYKSMEFEYEAIIPSAISSIIAYSVFSLFFGWQPLFATPEVSFTNPLELIPYLLLAVIVGLCAIIYVRSFYGVKSFFERLRIPAVFKPVIGGLFTGVIIFFIPQITGTGYGVLQDAFFEKTGILILLLTAFAKIIATSFTVGSGGSGGVFGPAILIGGTLGGAVGLAVQKFFPVFGVHSGSFALVGMAGFFAAAANTPISTIIMVSEMSGNFKLLVPSLWVSLVAYLIAAKHSLYEKQLESRLQSPVHQKAISHSLKNNKQIIDIINKLPQKKTVTILPQTPVLEFHKTNKKRHPELYVVVGNDRKFKGAVISKDIEKLISEDKLEPFLIAEDILYPEIFKELQNTLRDAAADMERFRINSIPIINDTKNNDFLRVITLEDINRFLNY